MTRKHWVDVGPSLVVGAGIIVATLIAPRATNSGWLVVAGQLLLALAVVGADMLRSRLQGSSSGPSAASLILAGGFLLAAVIATLREPKIAATLIPITGAAAWVVLLRPQGGRKACEGSTVDS